jgi:hypothetical protein
MLAQVNRAGTLSGLRDLTRMRIFEFRPYALAGAEKAIQTPATTVGSIGLDFNYLVNPTVKLDFTVHPDSQARGIALFRPQPIRRHPRSAWELAVEHDRGHAQIRLVFRSELKLPGFTSAESVLGRPFSIHPRTKVQGIPRKGFLGTRASSSFIIRSGSPG